MKRLVTFGCSLTYGAGLEDCWDGKHPGPNPSNLSWPQLLADALDIDCINNGICGASNKEILWYIQNFNFQEDDIVVILWSHLNRFCIIDNKDIDQIGLWSDTKRAKEYYKILYNGHDLLYDFYTRANYAKMLLDSQGIKNLHLSVHDKYIKKISWNTVQFEKIYMNVFRNKYPLALDNQHPGPRAHEQFGLAVLNRLKG